MQRVLRMRTWPVRAMLVVLGVALVIGVLGSPVAEADPLISGQIDFNGVFYARDSANNLVTDLTQATVIDVVSNTATVYAATGDLAGLTGLGGVGAVAYNDITISPFTAVTPLWSAGGFQFNLESLTVDSVDATSISLSGTGTLSASGFADTQFDWTLTGGFTPGTMTLKFFLNNGQTGGGTTSVPEPATLLLMSTGLAGVALVSRRRRRAE